MAALSLQVPYPVFYDRDGQPLDNGNIYVGTAYLDPVTNPIQVYYDEALTLPAVQPLKTNNGYIYRNGTPTQLYVNAVNFSITVKDSKNLLVYNFPDGTGILQADASAITFTGFKGQVGHVSDLAGNDGSDWIGFEANGVNAVARSAQDKMRDFVSVKDFGAVGDGVTDDATAITNAAIAALEDGKSLFFPTGQYYVGSIIQIDNSSYPQWSTLSWVGEEFVTGSGLFQNNVSGVTAGSVIITDGTSAVEVTMDNFYNESVRFTNLSFFNKGAVGLTCAIIVNKNSTSYVRGQEFHKLGFCNFDSCIVFQGQQPSINDNYFGPTTIQENFAYKCNVGFYLVNAYVNLFQISNSLYHDCTKYGIQIAANAGAVMSITNTHFEACEPAGIQAGGLVTVLNLDNVSAEATGVVSGYGILKASSSVNALTVNVSNSGYNQTGFALMPYEFRLNRGAIINASCPIQASGYGWITNTPDMVTPVVSNNALYNQTDLSTFAMCPLHDNVARDGNRVFAKFAGFDTGSQTSLSPPNSVNLPEGIRSRFVGTNSAATLIANITDTYTAPSDGYIYASWMGSFSAVDNGFDVANSRFLIDGAEKLIFSNIFGPYTGNFVLLVPIESGQVLGRTELVPYSAPSWATGVYMTFEENLLNMRNAASGYPRITTTVYTLATGNTLNLVDYTNTTTPYSINVKLFFNGGSKGYKEYVITGDGAVAANKTYTSVASVVVAGVAVTTNVGGNSQMYNIDIANTSGSPISITAQITYIS